MFQWKSVGVVAWAVMLGWLVAVAGQEVAVAAVPAPSRGKAPVAPQGRPTPTVPGKTPAAQDQEQLTPVKEAVLTDDHSANVDALQKQKYELLHLHTELLKRAMTAGQASQREVDRAALDEIRMELEMQERPHLRIAAIERQIEILKRIESEAEKDASLPQKKASGMVSSYGKVIGAKITRINAQLNLEREYIALNNPDAKDKDKKGK